MFDLLRKHRRPLARAVLVSLALAWLLPHAPAAACPGPALDTAASSPAHPRHTPLNIASMHQRTAHGCCAEHHGVPDRAGRQRAVVVCQIACAVPSQAPLASAPVGGADTGPMLALPVPASLMSAAEWTGLPLPHPSPPRGLPLSPVLEFRVLLI